MEHEKPRRSGALPERMAVLRGGSLFAPLVIVTGFVYFALRFQATRAATAAPTLSRANSDGSGTGLANAAAGARNNTTARMIENFI